ncbi:unnamed protein product [Linum trigynum]|uniref:Uncharacterized protein n=1 Tax=Linum trigynum TaxID=586398 RepID=A0AAV2FWA4_9ROSI
MPRANSVWPIQLQTRAPKHGRVQSKHGRVHREARPCFPTATGRVIKHWPKHGQAQAKHGRVLDRALATDAFKQSFSHNSRGFEFLRETTIPRERKRRTRVSKCPSLILITIGGQFELGEVPINIQEQESILHSMNSVSDSAFAFFSME